MYSPDSEAHAARVRALADTLRQEGVDVRLDQYETHPAEGWLRWTRRQIEEADFVLVVCTATYRLHFESAGTEGLGLAVAWQGAITEQIIFDTGTRNNQFIPVLFDIDEPEHIPRLFRSVTRYVLNAEYDGLYRHVTHQPKTPPPPVGEIRRMPPEAGPGPGAGSHVAATPVSQPHAFQSGGIFAPGATFNIGGDIVAGDKHEVHHLDGGSRRKPATLDPRAISIAPADFFEHWLRDDAPFNHRWLLVGRMALLGETTSAITSGSARVVLFEGRGGIGKSRVLIELWRRLEAAGLRVLVYKAGSLAANALVENPDGPLVLMIDDAQLLDAREIEVLIATLAARALQVSLVFAARPEGASAVRSICTNLNVPLLHRKIPNLSPEERVALAVQALGIRHSADAETLAATFEDSPLFITIGGSLIREGEMDARTIRSSETIRDLVFARFPTLLHSTPGLDALGLEAVTAITALLLPLPPADFVKLYPLLEPEAPNPARLRDQLLDLGVFADINESLRILPDLYGSYTVLRWAFRDGTSLGRLFALWQRLTGDHQRQAMLRNLRSVAEIASADQRNALRSELRRIWSERRRALDASPSRDASSAGNHLVALARELHREGVELADVLIRDRSDSEGRMRLCIQLLESVSRTCGPSDGSLHSRIVEIGASILRASPRGQEIHALDNLAHNPRIAERFMGLVGMLSIKEDCGTQLIQAACTVTASAFRTILRTADGDRRIDDSYRRLSSDLLWVFEHSTTELAMTALTALVRSLLTWWRVARSGDQRCAEGCLRAAKDRLDRLRVLISCRDNHLKYGVRGLVLEAVWRSSGPLRDLFSGMLRDLGDEYEAMVMALDPGYLPTAIFDARVLDRPQHEHAEWIEDMRTRAILRTLRSAPDLSILCQPQYRALARVLVEVVVVDAIVAGPAKMVGRAGSWISLTLEDGPSPGLQAALSHRLPADEDVDFRHLSQYYRVLRLDEHYALAVVRNSDATGAIAAAYALALEDVARHFERTLDTAIAIADEHDSAAAVWNSMERHHAQLRQVSHPNRYALIYALVVRRPEWAHELAARALEAETPAVDALSAVLQALWSHDRAMARDLAFSIAGAHPAAAGAIGVILPMWIAVSDEIDLVRAVIQCGDKDALRACYVALGRFMARDPGRAGDALAAIPSRQWQIESLLEGLLTSHFSTLSYPPEACEHIGQLLAPVGRSFASQRVIPNDFLSFEAALDNRDRIQRIVVGPEPPNLDRISDALNATLIAATVRSGALGSPSSQTYLVERALRAPCATLRLLLATLRTQRPGATLPNELLEAMMRPHLGAPAIADMIDVLIEAAHSEKEAERIDGAFLSCLWIMEAELHARFDRSDVSDELLIGLAHVFQRARLPDILVGFRLVQQLHDRAETASPLARQSVERLDRVRDHWDLEQIPTSDDKAIQVRLKWAHHVLHEVSEHSPAKRLYRTICNDLEALDAKAKRERDA